MTPKIESIIRVRADAILRDLAALKKRYSYQFLQEKIGAIEIELEMLKQDAEESERE